MVATILGDGDDSKVEEKEVWKVIKSLGTFRTDRGGEEVKDVVDSSLHKPRRFETGEDHGIVWISSENPGNSIETLHVRPWNFPGILLELG